jgi:hypothetical protein
VSRKDSIWALALALGSFLLYAATAAPSVATVFDDSLEFQVVLPTLGIAHPSGYPLYTLTGFLASKLIPLRDPAGRVNLLSALAAAAAIGVFFLVARRVSGSRIAAAIAAVALALSPVWWSQATIAEVYALHGLLVALFLYFLLRWEEAAPRDDRWLIAAALVAGLGLAHHRMIALLLPAAVVFVFWNDPGLLRQPRRWVGPLLAGLAPLLLYLYLPLRGQTITSLDGTYIPTAQGTLDWVLARAYSVFLTGNPFNVERDAGDIAALFFVQFGALFLLAALGGLLTGWRYSLRRWAFLLIATVSQVAFASAYKVQDVGVFFIPAFMLTALWAAWGLTPVLDSLALSVVGFGRSLRLPGALRPVLLGGAALLVAAVLLFEPVRAAARGFSEQDRSAAWAVYDAGQQTVDSVAPDGEVIGLLGETTLVRYFRDVLGQRRDIALTAADAEADRFAAIERALAADRPAYITRDLPGVAARYSLDAAGPLVRVSPKAAAGPAPEGTPMGAGVVLVSLGTEAGQTHAGTVVRVRPTWAASTPVSEELKVSARLVDGAGQVIAANDRAPVHFTYPTTAWAQGETVEDYYELSAPPGGPYRAQLILYRAADGSEVGRVEADVAAP